VGAALVFLCVLYLTIRERSARDEHETDLLEVAQK
jgi:hypothetical protein